MGYEPSCLNKDQIDKKLEKNKKEAIGKYLKGLLIFAILIFFIMAINDFKDLVYYVVAYAFFALFQAYNVGIYLTKMDELKKFFYIDEKK